MLFHEWITSLIASTFDPTASFVFLTFLTPTILYHHRIIYSWKNAVSLGNHWTSEFFKFNIQLWYNPFLQHYHVLITDCSSTTFINRNLNYIELKDQKSSHPETIAESSKKKDSPSFLERTKPMKSLGLFSTALPASFPHLCKSFLCPLQ